jgi:hypothetical protein
MADDGAMLYDDGGIACDDTNLIIRRYYLWGAKRIPYASMTAVTKRPLTAVRGKWRIWGSGDFVHWYNLDARRPKKELALEIDTGGRVRPTITPDDAETVDRILTEHLTR